MHIQLYNSPLITVFTASHISDKLYCYFHLFQSTLKFWLEIDPLIHIKGFWKIFQSLQLQILLPSLSFFFWYSHHTYIIFTAIVPLFSDILQKCVFNLQIFGDFPAVFLSLIYSLIPLWYEGSQCMISILLNLLRCVLWPRMWTILVNVPWASALQIFLIMLYRPLHHCCHSFHLHISLSN